MQFAVGVAGDVQHPAHQVAGQVIVVRGSQGSQVRQHVFAQGIGDVGVAQRDDVRGNVAGSGGQVGPDFRIAALGLVGHVDALFLADGLVEGFHLVLDHFQIRAGFAGGPEQDLNRFIRGGGQRKHDSQQHGGGQKKRYNFFHRGFSLHDR